MKRRKFLAGAGLLACGTAASGEAADEVRELRVLCYNIHFCRGLDGKFDVGRIAGVIRDARPDLVALQEIDGRTKRSGMVHQLRELAKLTGMHGFFGPTQHYHGGLYGNGILSRFPALEVVIEPLPYTPPTGEVITYPRGLIAVTVDLGGGNPLRIVSSHFQHILEEDRVAQAEAVNRLFGDREGDPVPTVLAADTNALPGSPPMKELGKHWRHAAGISMDYAPPGEADGGWQIDHVLVRKGDALSPKGAEIIDETNASDHRPILATIALGS